MAIAKINNRFASNYKGRKLEARRTGSQIRFYEIDLNNGKEFHLTRETINWLIQKRRILRAENREFIKVFKRK